jgi:opacity protein-like surface antigen
LGVGVNLPISNSADVIAEIAYLDVKYSIDNRDQGVAISESENGYGLTLGVRAMASRQLEVGITMQYADIGDASETAWKISADYFVSEALSLGVGFVKGSDIDAISVNARYNF